MTEPIPTTDAAPGANVDERIASARETLDELAGRPPAEQLAGFERVQSLLADALTDASD